EGPPAPRRGPLRVRLALDLRGGLVDARVRLFLLRTRRRVRQDDHQAAQQDRGPLRPGGSRHFALPSVLEGPPKASMQAPRDTLRLGQARRAPPSTELANMATGTILAIDLGKFKSVACVHRRDGGGTPAFHTVASTRAALLGLLDAVGPGVVVI